MCVCVRVCVCCERVRERENECMSEKQTDIYTQTDKQADRQTIKILNTSVFTYYA